MKQKTNKFYYILLLIFITAKANAQYVTVKVYCDTADISLTNKTKILFVQSDTVLQKKMLEPILVKSRIPFTLSFSNPEILIKDFKKLVVTNDTVIHINNTQLSAVVVNAKKTLVTQSLSGYSYFPQQDSLFLKKSIAYGMQRLPFVNFMNNQLSFKNGEKIKFLINGRERNGIGENWNEILQNITVERILRVDLDTDPTVRIKNEGYGAVINILTMDANIKGSSGGIGISFDTRENINPNGNLTILNKKSDIAMRVSANSDKLNNSRIFELRDENTKNLLSFDSTQYLQQYSTVISRIDYGLRIDSTKDFNVSLNYINSTRNNKNQNLLNIPTERSNNVLSSSNNSLNLQLGYSLSKKKWAVNNFAFSGTINNDNQINNISTVNKKLVDSVGGTYLSRPIALAIKYNYQNLKNANSRYESGLLTYYKRYNSDVNIFNRQLSGTNKLVKTKKDSLLQNQLSIKPFFSLLKSLSKTSNLRIEFLSEIFLVKNKDDKQIGYFLPETYFRLYKLINKTTSFVGSTRFSFKKPNIDYLNPVLINDNPLFSRIGLNNLKPEKNINLSLELNTRKKVFTSHNIYFSRSYDVINQFNIFQNSNYIAVSNNKTSSFNLAYYFRLQGNLKSKFFYTIAPSITFSSFKNTAFNSRYNGFTWSISSNGNYSVKNLGDFGYNGFINGRGNNAQGYNFGTVMYGIYYGKNIYKKMFFVTVSADNFAQKNRFAKSLVNNRGVSNLITTITPNRLFSLTLSFNFNKIKYAKYSKKTSVDVNDQVERLK